MPEPPTPRRDDADGSPFWLSPWPFLEPRYPDWLLLDEEPS